MPRKAINTRRVDLDEVVELDFEPTKVASTHNIQTRPVGKNELTTPIGTERLHASRPWNKYRPKARG